MYSLVRNSYYTIHFPVKYAISVYTGSFPGYFPNSRGIPGSDGVPGGLPQFPGGEPQFPGGEITGSHPAYINF